MKTKYIDQNIKISLDTAQAIYSNCEAGDRRVTLMRADDMEGNDWYYLETNGDPVVVSDDYESMRDCSATLGISVGELEQLLNLQHI